MPRKPGLTDRAVRGLRIFAMLGPFTNSYETTRQAQKDGYSLDDIHAWKFGEKWILDLIAWKSEKNVRASEVRSNEAR